jgi:hypothetical protein
LALKSVAASASTARAAIEVFQRTVMGEPPFRMEVDQRRLNRRLQLNAA